MSRHAMAVNGAQNVFNKTNDVINHSNGQSVALDRMLKK